MDWKKYIGKRVLIKKLFSGDIIEAKVIEVSPSGKYAKIELALGVDKWIDTSIHALLEVLE